MTSPFSSDTVKKESKRSYFELDNTTDQMIEQWAQHVVFTWQWWLGVALAVIPWILWLVFRKKDSTGRLLLAGFSALIVSSWLDFYGTSNHLWYYMYEVIPLHPAHIPWNFTLIPVIVMTLIQYRPELSPWIKARGIRGPDRLCRRTLV